MEFRRTGKAQSLECAPDSHKGRIKNDSVRVLFSCPLSQLEALELPDIVERATQRPHANMYMTANSNAHALTGGLKIHIPTSAIYCCHILDYINEIFQVSSCQERARSKRQSYVNIPPTVPISGLCRRYASANIIQCCLNSK